MIHRLRDMIGPDRLMTRTYLGRPVRAVPEPFGGGLADRIADAWSVLTGRTVAVHWPAPGDLERAMEWKLLMSARQVPWQVTEERVAAAFLHWCVVDSWLPEVYPSQRSDETPEQYANRLASGLFEYLAKTSISQEPG